MNIKLPPYILLMTLVLTACGGGSSGSSSNDTDKTQDDSNTQEQQNQDGTTGTNDQTGGNTDFSTLSVEEKREIAFAAIEKAYELPAEGKAATYQSVSEGLQLSQDDLAGAWVMIAKEKACSAWDCEMVYTRKVFKYRSTSRSLSTACEESMEIDEEGNITYSSSTQSGRYGPVEVEVINKQHLRGYMSPNSFAIEYVADYYKISDDFLLLLGTVDGTVDGVEHSGNINCYHEVARVEYDFATQEAEHNIFIVAKTLSSGAARVHIKPDNSFNIRYSTEHYKPAMVEKSFMEHDYSLDKDVWFTTGTFDYLSNENDDVVGTLSFAVSGFASSAESEAPPAAE